MRIWNALKADMRFQFKQGFYIVYMVLTLMYMIIIGQLPRFIGDIAVPLIVFSDPSVVGFFFIGGIVMLEKVQGILQYIVVTPLRSREYLLAKVISLAILAEAAGIAISVSAYGTGVDWFLLTAGILLSSVFFTLVGFVAAAGCQTVNQYFIRMVPYMLILVLPCFALLDFPYSGFFAIFPSLAGLKLVYGAYHGIGIWEALLYCGYLVAANGFLFRWVEGVFNRRIVCGGEGA